MPDYLKSLRKLAGAICYTSLDDGSTLSFDDEVVDDLSDGESYIEQSMALMRSRIDEAGRPAAFRLDYPQGGVSDYCVFPEDFAFVVHRGILVGPEPLNIQYFIRNYCVLRIQLRGHLEEDIGGEHLARASGHCSLIFPGKGIHYGFHQQGPQPIYSVTMQFPVKLLEQSMSLRQLQQLELFQGRSPSPASQFVRIPSSPLLIDLGHQMLALDLSATTARLAGKGLMLQMIAEAASKLLGRAQEQPDVTRLRQRDIERLNAIRARMDEALADTHSIEELARWSGLNRRKLTEGFKEQSMSLRQLQQLELFQGRSPSPASQFVRIPSSPLLIDLGHQMLALDLSATTARLAGKGLMLQMIAEAASKLLGRAQEQPDVTRLRQRDIERLNAIRARMDEALADTHSIEELARWSGLNRRKLTEGFKVLFGTTVADYLQRKRMLAARDLLTAGESVGAAAEAVGYQDRTSFSRAFRKVHGHSPMESRQASSLSAGGSQFK